MCGEKDIAPLCCTRRPGSPPHVRGKVKAGDFTKDTFRITPACAGKRIEDITALNANKDHPRMCGEKTKKIP